MGERVRHRLCAYCGKIKPETLKHYRQRRRERNNEVWYTWGTQCITCELEKDRLRREARRAGRKPPALDHSTPSEAAFQATVAQMEQAHGPMKTWSREVHLAHTKMLWKEVAQRTTDIRLLPDTQQLTFARHPDIDYGNPLYRPPRQGAPADREGVFSAG